MAQTKEGAKKAQATMRAKYGEKYHTFYQTIGSIGGRRSKRGGFASDKVGKDGLTGRERASVVGKKGGHISRRTNIKNGEGRKSNRDIDEAERILEEELASGRD